MPRTLRVRSALTRLADRRLLALSVVIWLALAGVLFAWHGRGSVAAVTRACGREAPDVRFAPSPAQTRAFVASCGDRGLDAYRDLQVVDLFYPAAGAFLLVLLMALALRHASPRLAGLAWLTVVPVVAALGDYLENACAWVFIGAGASAPSWAASVLHLASAVKVTLTWISWLILTVLVIGRHAIRVRPPTHGPVRAEVEAPTSPDRDRDVVQVAAVTPAGPRW